MKKLLMAGAVLTILGTACNNSNNDKASNADSLNNATTTTTTTTKTVRTVEVTPVIKASFEKSYPAAKEVAWVKYEPMPETESIDWEMTGWPTLDTSDYMANFTIDNSPYWSWYTYEGDWVGTYTPINTSGLPDPVNATVQKEFPGYTISSVNKEMDKHRTAYEIKMQNGEDKMKALIGADGKLLKKKGKEAGIKIKEKPVKDS